MWRVALSKERNAARTLESFYCSKSYKNMWFYVFCVVFTCSSTCVQVDGKFNHVPSSTLSHQVATPPRCSSGPQFQNRRSNFRHFRSVQKRKYTQPRDVLGYSYRYTTQHTLSVFLIQLRPRRRLRNAFAVSSKCSATHATSTRTTAGT